MPSQAPVAARGPAISSGLKVAHSTAFHPQAELVLEAAESACAPPSSAATAALARPLVSPLANEAELASFEVCRSARTPTSLDMTTELCARPLRGAPPDWRCYADAPGRQGWLAHAAAQPGTIRFPLLLHGDNAPVSVGCRLPALLRLYEGFGRARFWLDRDERWGVEMDGAWRSPTSEPDMLVVPAAELCGPSCTAAARSRGKKGNHRHEASVQMLPEPANSTKKFMVECGRAKCA